MRLDRAIVVLMDSSQQGHVLHRFSDFLMSSSFSSKNNCSHSVLAKNWRLCTQLAASACKICFRVALSSIVPAHFPNQISNGPQLNNQKHGGVCGLANAKKYNYDVKKFLYTPLVCLSCTRVAASHMTGGHLGTIYIQLAANRMQTLHALAASCMQSRQFFASTLREQLL